jgi:hypothetical protein
LLLSGGYKLAGSAFLLHDDVAVALLDDALHVRKHVAPKDDEASRVRSHLRIVLAPDFDRLDAIEVGAFARHDVRGSDLFERRLDRLELLVDGAKQRLVPRCANVTDLTL